MQKVEKFVKYCWANVTVEPAFFFFALAQGIYIVIAQSLYISKVCNVNLNFTREVCDNIQQYPEHQIEVQKYTSVLQSYNSVIQAIPTCLYSLFAGPWSDRHGRKVLIICATFGYVFNNAVFMINTYFFYELKAEYLLFECLQDMTGGHVCFYLACYSYITDITTKENRTKRLALLDGLFPLGFYIGNAASGYIKRNLGFMYNFSLGMLFAVVAMSYTIIFVKDSRNIRNVKVKMEREEELANTDNQEDKLAKIKKWNDEEEAEVAKNSQGLIRSFINWDNLKSSWVALLRKRDGHKRMFIILVIVAFELEIFALVGRWNTLFLFFRKHLQWTEIEYSRFTTILGFIAIVSQYVAIPFLSEKLKLHDSTISLIDMTTSFFNQFVIAFSVNEWMLYCGATVAFLDYTSTTLLRAIITKNVNADEIGKVFSIVGTFQALMPFISSPTFGFLYKETVSYLPQAFLFLIASVKLVESVIVFVVNYGMRRELRRQEKLKPEDTELKSLNKKVEDDES